MLAAFPHLWLVATVLAMQPLTVDCLIAKSSLSAVLEGPDSQSPCGL